MKIRIKANSVRLRLTRSDVDRFGREGCLEERTEFGTNELVYAIQTTGNADITADFKNGKITVFVPQPLANQWTGTEKVGFDSRMPLGNGKDLYILVEKDFKCLDETIEDQSDNYENPLAIRK